MADDSISGPLLRGVALGFSIAAPVGPIGLLCLRRTLAEGHGIGFATGMGAATADAVYGTVAALGLGAVSGFLVRHQTLLQGFGALFLIWLGVQSLRSPASEEASGVPARSALGAFASTFGLTLANPMTILSFLAMFSATGSTTGNGRGGAWLLVAGVFLGSSAWWLALTTAAAFWKSRISVATRTWINRIAGLFLLAWGLRILFVLARTPSSGPT